MTEEEESKNLLDADGTLRGTVISSGGFAKYFKVGILIFAGIALIYMFTKKRSRK